jgi:DNA-binding response OmpR family regulator
MAVEAQATLRRTSPRILTDVLPRATRGRVLAVDDDEAILAMLARVLGEDGFAVEGATTAAGASAALRAGEPDVVLLDIGLADADGYEILGALRKDLDMPVIIVTARGTEPERLRGLRAGADDYVVKPFSYPELSARIENVLRRVGRAQQPLARAFGPLRVDLAAREVRVDGQPVRTTAKEFDLLAFLTAAPGRVFTRQELLHHVWVSSSEWQDPATVTEHIRRLRLKIEPGHAHAWIITVPGIGYRFDA